MKQKTKIFLIGLDEPECQGVFNEKGTLISYWSANDASFRIEYFSDLMEYLGVEVCEPASKAFRSKLEKTLYDEVKNW